MIASSVPFLRIGVTDDQVVRLREILNVTGTDVFDTSLSIVVRGFQRTHGLLPTGEVDEETANALGL